MGQGGNFVRGSCIRCDPIRISAALFLPNARPEESVAVNVDLTTGIQDNGGALMDAHLFSFSKRKESGGTVA